jgi:UDP-N-acetylmuramoylalanine--D-glutamate ligase
MMRVLADGIMAGTHGSNVPQPVLSDALSSSRGNNALGQRPERSAAVIGMGIEGGSLVRYFLRHGARVTVHHWMAQAQLEQHPQLGPQYRALRAAGAEFCTGDAYLTGLTRHDVVGVLQSAFTYKYPENRAALAEVQDLGIPLVTNLSIFFDECPAPIIGVTGTNGKTTATEMAAAILSRGTHRVWAGGNLGASPLDILDDLDAHDLVLLELSNYQLEFLDESPWIAAVTNIAPDHLIDYHGDYKRYKAAKRRIISFQERDDWAVLNHDDPVTRAWLAACQAQPMPFSRRERLRYGVFVDSDAIVVRRPEPVEGQKPIVAISELQVRGGHNVENALCATAIGILASVPGDEIAAALRGYVAGEHRLEYVGEWRDIRFYNDSKSTTPSSTLAAVQAFPQEPVILLIGGRDKELPWGELARTANASCKEIIAFGEAREMLAHAFTTAESQARASRAPSTPSGSAGHAKFETATTLEQAVEIAVRDARPGDVILFSPACTSFDAFDSYAERGRRFKEFVHEVLDDVE